MTPGSNPGAPTSMFKSLLNFFDKFEDKVRGRLSHLPILYSIIGGVAVVLFWRGVWHTADILQAKGGILGFVFYEPINMIIIVFVLLATGLMVSVFIGDTVLMSGLKHQKKIGDKTEKEIEEEEIQLESIKATVREIKKEVDEIKEAIEKK